MQRTNLLVDDLPVGTPRLTRVDGRRLCVIRTADGVYALDHACPHMGYGMTQGTIDGNLLTCAWHNWKFDVRTGQCVQGEEDIGTHPVQVDGDGQVHVELRQADPAGARDRRLASLTRGIERNYIGQVSREVIRLLQSGATPAELVALAVSYGAPRGEWGLDHSMAMATDALAMTELYHGDQRALPVVQAISGFAEVERDRPVQHPADPATRLPRHPAAAFRQAVEAEDAPTAQALVRAAVRHGYTADELQPWFTAVVADHHLDYGHQAIYTQKSFELLAMIGWAHADTVLAHLARGIVAGTREDLLPYMRPFISELDGLDLQATTAADPAWPGRNALVDAMLGGERRGLGIRLGEELRNGAGVEGLLDAAVLASCERLLRYDVAGEQDLLDDFGWLDITHGVTYAHAARWHYRRSPGVDATRLALFACFLAHYTGRHEWHTRIAERVVPEPLASDDLVAAGHALQRESLGDHAGAFIVAAHDVKLSRAASLEAVHLGSPVPLQATARYMRGPRAQRFVAGSVARSIDFLSGRAPRDQDEGLSY